LVADGVNRQFDKLSQMLKLLGIDVGTSGCKALLIDETGKILKEAAAEYPISSPQPFWSEQDPEHWIAGVTECLIEIGERRPDAIGLTGQMHGSVFLDAHGQVVRPAILWNDQRTVAECEEIDRIVGPERVRQITCNPPMTGFQLPKILWLRNHEPENFSRVEKVLLPKDYIRYRLSGQFATEVSDASGTGLFDVPNRCWSSEMATVLDLPLSLFPPAFESDEATSRTNGEGFLEAGVPIVGGGGDQAAAAVGTGAVMPGITSVSLGTSGVVFTAIPEAAFDPKGSTHTFCHANRGWHAMGVMLSCGGALRWFRDTMAHGNSYDDLAKLADSVQPGAEGVRFLPYLTGERCPYIDPFATASFSGLRLGHSLPHLSRAVFESATDGLASAMELLGGLGATKDEIRVTGGGAKSDFWVQLIADMFDSRCVTLVIDEGPAFGAAILAGVAIGVWENVSAACAQVVKKRKQFLPRNINYNIVRGNLKELYVAQRNQRQ
jgi:xylulokinase